MKRVKKIFIDDSGDQPRLVFYTNGNKEYEAINHSQGFALREVTNSFDSWEEFLKNIEHKETVIKNNKIVSTYGKKNK